MNLLVSFKQKKNPVVTSSHQENKQNLNLAVNKPTLMLKLRLQHLSRLEALAQP